MAIRTLQPRRIYNTRLRLGLSQEDLSFRLRQRGVAASAKQVGRWEKGAHAPRASVIPALADALGVSIDELYGDDSDEEDDPAAMFDRAARALTIHGEHGLAADLRRQAIHARDMAKEPA